MNAFEALAMIYSGAVLKGCGTTRWKFQEFGGYNRTSAKGKCRMTSFASLSVVFDLMHIFANSRCFGLVTKYLSFDEVPL